MGWVCVVKWHLVSVRTFGVMDDHTFSKLAHHQIRRQATHKSGLSAWWLHMINIGTCSLKLIIYSDKNSIQNGLAVYCIFGPYFFILHNVRHLNRKASHDHFHLMQERKWRGFQWWNTNDMHPLFVCLFSFVVQIKLIGVPLAQWNNLTFQTLHLFKKFCTTSLRQLSYFHKERSSTMSS